MHAHAPALFDDVSAADWIAPRLGGEFGAVGLQVPRCAFDAWAVGRDDSLAYDADIVNPV